MGSKINYLKACFVMLFIVLNTVFWFVLMLSLGILKFLLPFKSAHIHLDAGLDLTLNGWVGIIREMSALLNICNIEVVSSEDFQWNDANWYIVVCNHQTWADILILQNIFWGKIPPLKFFTKKQLLYLPLLGTAMWIQDFPYVDRPSAEKLAAHPELASRDRENTRMACEKFGKRPTTILNFLEGTRFSQTKHAKFNSSYKHLLNPKVGGFGILAEHLGEKVDKIIDVTILYPPRAPYPPQAPGFIEYIAGECKTVRVEISCHELPASLIGANFGESETLRSELREWVRALWQIKDNRLAEHHRQIQDLSNQVNG